MEKISAVQSDGSLEEQGQISLTYAENRLFPTI